MAGKVDGGAMRLRLDALAAVVLLVVAGFAYVDAKHGLTPWHKGPKLDFSGAKGKPHFVGAFEGRDFAGATFADCDVRNGNVTRSEMKSCRVTDVRLTRVQLTDSTAERVIGANSKFWGGSLANSSISNGTLGWVKGLDLTMFNVTVKQSNLVGGTLHKGIVEKGSLAGGRIHGAQVQGVRAELTRFSDSTLRDPVLQGGTLEDSFVFCDPMVTCELRGVSVARTRIENATVRGGVLLDVVLVNVQLIDVTPRQTGAASPDGAPQADDAA